MKKIVFILAVLVTTVVSAQKSEFSANALAEEMTTLDGGSITLASILEKYKGKTVVVDVWASWCSDCVKGMPKVKELQKEYKGKPVVFLFLSLDKSYDSWKKGIEKYEVTGEHYFVQKGWKESAFCADIKLDWIPRYMIVDKTGAISYFKAIEANDDKFIKHLKQLK